MAFASYGSPELVVAERFAAPIATRYPNAPVTAPFANLPPPATEARPPAVAWIIVPPISWLRSVCAFGNNPCVIGENPALTAPAAETARDASTDGIESLKTTQTVVVARNN
jgi:hypothetical protein